LGTTAILRLGAVQNGIHPSQGRDHIRETGGGKRQQHDVNDFLGRGTGRQALAGVRHDGALGIGSDGDAELDQVLGLFVQRAGLAG